MEEFASAVDEAFAKIVYEDTKQIKTEVW